jgi:hypothetical protein
MDNKKKKLRTSSYHTSVCIQQAWLMITARTFFKVPNTCDLKIILKPITLKSQQQITRDFPPQKHHIGWELNNKQIGER